MLVGNKHVFISAGSHDPIVPGQETQNLFNLLKKAGVADISINWQNSGHELILEEIRKTKDWLLRVLSSKNTNEDLALLFTHVV